MTIRILVYEYLSSGALDGQPGVESLAREGQAMLAAVLADLGRCPGVEVVSPRRCTDPEPVFRQSARQAAFALLIAPEFDDLLARCATWAVEEGCRLLGPSVDAIRLTTDKFRLADHLERAGVPTIPTRSLQDRPPWKSPWVYKPRFGAGSQATFLVHNEAERLAIPGRALAEGFSGEMIVQPYLPSRDGPVSLACLIGPEQRFPLALMRQTLSEDGRFRYRGGERALDLDEELYRRVALTALDAVPGLLGYVGFDLLWPLGADRPVVVEINPRLTTSYVGLRALCDGNLMQMLLDLVVGRRHVEPPIFRHEQVRFSADGTLSA